MILQPVEYKVLVLLDPTERVTEGGIVLPEDVADKEQQKQVVGTLIAVGGNAFQEVLDPIPQVGDKVMIAKYSGLVHKANGKEYRLCNDKDIGAIVRSEQ